MEKLLVLVFAVVIGVLIGVFAGAIFALPTMWLWNGLMPDIFHLPTISFFQAWGLLILSHLLVKGSSGGSSNS